jgi:hypothetical protein
MWYVLFVALSNGKAPLLRSVDDNAWTNTMLAMVTLLLGSWLIIAGVMLGPLLFIFPFVPASFVVLGAILIIVTHRVTRGVGGDVDMRIVVYWGIFGDRVSSLLLRKGARAFCCCSRHKTYEEKLVSGCNRRYKSDLYHKLY